MSARLLNPERQLLAEFASRLQDVRKTKPLWAKPVEVAGDVDTLEGRLKQQTTDYLCRGAANEQWPQNATKLLGKYTPSGEFDGQGWQRFDPKPDSQAVGAVQVDEPFQVLSDRGTLNGKAGDYLVRSKTDPTDVWIVDRAIFLATYEFVDKA